MKVIKTCHRKKVVKHKQLLFPVCMFWKFTPRVGGFVRELVVTRCTYEGNRIFTINSY